MYIERTTTGLIIHKPNDEMKRKVLRYFSLSNPLREFFIYSGNNPNKQPIFGKEHDTIYISSGFLNINDPMILNIGKVHVIQPMTPSQIDLKMNRQPRSKLQEDCIKMITDPNAKNNKVTIELKPGVELITGTRIQ